MSIIGEFTIPAEGFALDEALSAVPEMTIEADRLASHSTMEVFPFLWATGGDFDAFQAALDDDPTVTKTTVAEESDDEVLYRMEWHQEFCDLIDEIVDHHAVISEAHARDGKWHLKLRFAEEGMVTEFQTHFRDEGHEFEVHALSHPSEPRQREYGLTEEQHDALVAAAREGYFDVPRTTSVEELGDILGVSANAVSQRLRRGTETLVQDTLILSEEDMERS